MGSFYITPMKGHCIFLFLIHSDKITTQKVFDFERQLMKMNQLWNSIQHIVDRHGRVMFKASPLPINTLFYSSAGEFREYWMLNTLRYLSTSSQFTIDKYLYIIQLALNKIHFHA